MAPKAKSKRTILGIGGGPINKSKTVHGMFYLALEKAISRQADPSQDPVIVSIPTAKHTIQTFNEHVGMVKLLFGLKGFDVKILHSYKQRKVDLEALRQLLNQADLIVVPGGSTELLVKEWRRMGLLPLILDAVKRGVVVVGHSAGLICWFAQCHTDSEDYVTPEGQPWLYKMIEGAGMEEGESLFPEIAVCPHGFDIARKYTHNDEAYSAKFTRRQDFIHQLRELPQRINGFAVDGDTGVLFEGHWGTVHGTGRVTLHTWSKDGRLRSRAYKPGQRFRLSTLAKSS